ncbi:thiol-disulfide oxidoreductase ResA [Pontibacillus sp. HMF3514]|uniref:thiol-disulfide oxidoreductase ResA n=1 Tax=Pontibacillus sp. HMF3514 TaxID=2692425 RepID=UPI00131F6758|nr:thiol-disulfide oxidoreductase ResA [Pontibacillus sp. HMF3514]QHE52365.1 thiol-disulfide oxidoreductase ResA [Pontibacillus sp. HMF3514]
MKKTKKRLFFRLGILTLFVAAIVYMLYQSFTEEDQDFIKAGDKAPDFVLKTLSGEKVQLSDYQGKGVFLNFWATYCPPCKKEMPFMENQYQHFKDKGVKVLAVDVGEPRVTVQGFVEEYGLTFPIPMDQNKDVLDAYGVGPIPVTFLINKEGIVEKRVTAGLTEQDIRRFMLQIQPEEYKKENN